MSSAAFASTESGTLVNTSNSSSSTHVNSSNISSSICTNNSNSSSNSSSSICINNSNVNSKNSSNSINRSDIRLYTTYIKFGGIIKLSTTMKLFFASNRIVLLSHSPEHWLLPVLLPEGPGVDLAHVLGDQVVEAVEAEATDELAGELNSANSVAQRVKRGGPGKGKKTDFA